MRIYTALFFAVLNYGSSKAEEHLHASSVASDGDAALSHIMTSEGLITAKEATRNKAKDKTPHLRLKISEKSTHCGCDSCNQSVWDTVATNSGGSYTCGARISWLQTTQGYDEAAACSLVSSEFADGPCGPACDPAKCASMCGCASCTGSVLNSMANGYTCESRIIWVIENEGASETDACIKVADEYPDICGECHSNGCGSQPPATPPSPPVTPPSSGGAGGTVKVMSYNTEYSGYRDGRFSNFAQHIVSIGADVVGLQECQDSGGIAAATGYSLLDGSAGSGGNTVLYKGDRLRAIGSGHFEIPRDEHARRTISWGQFQIIEGSGSGSEFWFFNTHLPHNSWEAADRNTHARIARMLLEERAQSGAENSPTIVTGDCNVFASAGASEGSFEDNLAAGGIPKVYVATGSTGGHAGLDKIFASQAHWTTSNAHDAGTGSSDHPAIVVDLTLERG